MLKHESGVLAATTAFGKTVLAAWLIFLACRSFRSRMPICFAVGLMVYNRMP
jgi:hypothetical protein